MSKGIKTQRPTSATLIISLILWVIGTLSTVLGVISLPNNLGVWSLIVAGALMILGSLFNNI
jgi:uncharacterized membrane protein YoaT (DUF817 family)